MNETMNEIEMDIMQNLKGILNYMILRLYRLEGKVNFEQDIQGVRLSSQRKQQCHATNEFVVV